MLNEHLNSFLSHLKIVRQLSPHTIKNYGRDLIKFVDFLEGETDKWEEVQEHQVRDFINMERRRGLNSRSLQRMLSSFRSFFSYLLDEEIAHVTVSYTHLTLPTILDV